ncbi:MAG: glycosyl hydrolase family 8 [Nannocystales bacterium]
MRALPFATLVSVAFPLAGCGAPDDAEEVEATDPQMATEGEDPAMLGGCALATNADDNLLQAAFDVWKSELVTEEGAGGFRRVVRPDTPDGVPNSTVSEGIAYGMLIAVAMDDQPLFDDLWQYAQLWVDQHGLMQWYIDPTGTEACPGRDPAEVCGASTDSDEDMAWALLQAAQRWGGSGALSQTYLDAARAQIERIYDTEVERGFEVIRPGDTWGGYQQTNPSYFAPAYYRAFGVVTDNVEGWDAVIDSSYEVIFNSLNADNGNTDNGLVPAWCNYEGTPIPPEPPGPGQLPDDNWQYDSARIPFRIAQDACYHDEPRARDYLETINSFYASVGVDNIIDGYALDGTPRPDERSVAPTMSAVFVGCAGVGMMADLEGQAFVDRAYERVAGLDMLTRSRYYQRSWTVLSMLMLSGRLPPIDAQSLAAGSG